jgi:hypothetical protein
MPVRHGDSVQNRVTWHNQNLWLVKKGRDSTTWWHELPMTSYQLLPGYDIILDHSDWSVSPDDIIFKDCDWSNPYDVIRAFPMTSFLTLLIGYRSHMTCDVILGIKGLCTADSAGDLYYLLAWTDVLTTPLLKLRKTLIFIDWSLAFFRSCLDLTEVLIPLLIPVNTDSLELTIVIL